ncbi:hypothetical protein ATSB10_13820 [Dyella thiooxydans]|uniref:DUF4396 domain-containing protein n=1 Tax=Dyella thiooxydans TaxID=445710 RepID=A0A160MZP0_9GAMM|nr:DUF4396 domain-containing protein [Dyella thiooxydans]AND68836.1 hypothetical protein ATSB10_13820 [Dyella thiooxydans]
MPEWLHVLALVSLVVAMACAALIALDIALGRRQPMAIMNLVWPITALYAGPLGLWAYARIGRAPRHGDHGHHGERPFAQSVMLAATHCGSGCTLGDLTAESLLLALPFTLFGSELLTGWTLDFVFAFVIGIAFQYFTIRPMGEMSAREALLAALKADTLSLVSWQVGMYGWMAIATFGLFGGTLDKAGPVFWLMMQIAMLAGFATACPVNAWLLKRGIKHPM